MGKSQSKLTSCICYTGSPDYGFDMSTELSIDASQLNAQRNQGLNSRPVSFFSLRKVFGDRTPNKVRRNNNGDESTILDMRISNGFLDRRDRSERANGHGERESRPVTTSSILPDETPVHRSDMAKAQASRRVLPSSPTDMPLYRSSAPELPGIDDRLQEYLDMVDPQDPRNQAMLFRIQEDLNRQEYRRLERLEIEDRKRALQRHRDEEIIRSYGWYTQPEELSPCARTAENAHRLATSVRSRRGTINTRAAQRRRFSSALH